MRTEKEVVLVNERDESLGTMEKMEAHRRGVLHRAFSVFIFNGKGEMLLQQRASGKYHSGGLSTNACCSHPRKDEKLADAAAPRLIEEMGFSVSLKKIFDFIYRSEMENGLTEHEFDHVFAGNYDGVITPDKEEVKDYCYKSLESIRQNLQSHPHHFTAWFHIAFPRVEKWQRDLQQVV